MTGEQHYRAAENLLGLATEPDQDAATTDRLIAQAHVHATLAGAYLAAPADARNSLAGTDQ